MCLARQLAIQDGAKVRQMAHISIKNINDFIGLRKFACTPVLPSSRALVLTVIQGIVKGGASAADVQVRLIKTVQATFAASLQGAERTRLSMQMLLPVSRCTTSRDTQRTKGRLRGFLVRTLSRLSSLEQLRSNPTCSRARTTNRIGHNVHNSHERQSSLLFSPVDVQLSWT